MSDEFHLLTTGHIPNAVKRYQEQFSSSLSGERAKTARFVTVTFGFTPQDASEISKLIIDGMKTATGSLLWSYQADGKPLPSVGDLWVVIDGESKPVCVAQTTNVEINAFNEVPQIFAWLGGEGTAHLRAGAECTGSI